MIHGRKQQAAKRALVASLCCVLYSRRSGGRAMSEPIRDGGSLAGKESAEDRSARALSSKYGVALTGGLRSRNRVPSGTSPDADCALPDLRPFHHARAVTAASPNRIRAEPLFSMKSSLAQLEPTGSLAWSEQDRSGSLHDPALTEQHRATFRLRVQCRWQPT